MNKLINRQLRWNQIVSYRFIQKGKKINCTESIILLFILSFIIAISTHFLSEQFQELIASSFAPVRTSMAKQMSHFCIRPFHSFFLLFPFLVAPLTFNSVHAASISYRCRHRRLYGIGATLVLFFTTQFLICYTNLVDNYIVCASSESFNCFVSSNSSLSARIL